MAALEYDLHIDQGSDYRLRVPVLGEDNQPLLLYGWSARGTIRATYGSPFVLYDLGNAIELGDTFFDVAVTANTSELWEWRQGVYDIELVDAGGAPHRLMQGRVFVSPEVTR